jgi:hypothetical protein
VTSSKFIATPFSLPWGSSLYAKVLAINIKGNSIASDAGNGGIILTTPDSPTSLANVQAITNYNTVGLSWSNGVNNGGSTVIDYRVSYKISDDLVFYTLESNIVSLPYSASALTVGLTYMFKVQARNIYGYSGFSSTISVLVA